MEQTTVQDRHEIDAQVERILEHPLFHQSKRLPVFLRHIVNESLHQGPDGSVKERTLGHEVFGRKPDYDNNLDPIVRVTATELRKKLAQYYYEDGHSDEIRIELPPGSYLPRFRKVQSAASEAEPAEAGVLPAAAADETNPQPADASAHTAPQWNGRVWIAGVGALSLVLAIVVALFLVRGWQQTHAPLNRFWGEVVSNSGPVLIVMPVIGSDNVKGAETELRSVSVRPVLSLEDTSIAVHIAGQLERHNAPYRLVSSSEVTFDEIRTGPSVLIGALDNIWTIRLMRDLPFVFEEAPDHRTGRIVDASSGGSRNWTVDINMPHTRITHDYGIVARYTNRLTGKPVVVVAGISSQGTQAAGELVSSAEFEAIRSLASSARNFEAILDTEAIDGQASRPRIVASKSW